MSAVTHVVAHRGSSADVPEHTLAAYVRAIDDGADSLECDVRLTADGHLVCVHDRRIDRTSNGSGVVSTMTLNELNRHDFGAWHGEDEQTHGRRFGAALRETLPILDALPILDNVPILGRPLTSRDAITTDDGDPVVVDEERHTVLTLERLLELVVDSEREVGLAIETKHPTRYGALVEERTIELLSRFGLNRPRSEHESRIRIMSFAQLSMRRVRALAPGLAPRPWWPAAPGAVLEVPLTTVFTGRWRAHGPRLYPRVTPRWLRGIMARSGLLERVPLRLRDGSLPFGTRIAGPSIDIIRAHPGYVERVHKAGGQVHVWTVDDEADVDLCADLGVDAVITNRPSATLTRLGRPGGQPRVTHAG